MKNKHEYISKAKLKEAFEEDGHLSAYVEETIDSVQADNVVERKTGVWLMDKMTRTCSACGQMRATSHKDNFCPNCGADMRPTSMSGARGGS